MFGVQHREGAVMLSYNSTYTRRITNSPCTPPAPCTLDFISHSCTSPMHMAIVHTPLSLRRVITSTRSYRAHAHALHATTSSCVITPTATAYAPHNLVYGHIRNVTPCTYYYNMHVHILRLCMRIPFAFTCRARCTTERNANHTTRYHARRSAPR